MAAPRRRLATACDQIAGRHRAAGDPDAMIRSEREISTYLRSSEPATPPGNILPVIDRHDGRLPAVLAMAGVDPNMSWAHIRPKFFATGVFDDLRSPRSGRCIWRQSRYRRAACVCGHVRQRELRGVARRLQDRGGRQRDLAGRHQHRLERRDARSERSIPRQVAEGVQLRVSRNFPAAWCRHA